MKYKFAITIAGISICIKSQCELNIHGKELNKYKNFLSTKFSKKKYNVELSLFSMSDYINFSQKKIVFEANQKSTGENNRDSIMKNTNWRMSMLNNQLLLEANSPGKFQALLSRNFNSGKIFFINLGRVWRIEEAVDSFLKIFFVHYLVRYKIGVLIHAVGISYENQGYLFSGRSGAGKSTTARIWSNFGNAKILNDDRVIIKKEKRNFFIYSTPWHGDYADYLGTPIEKTRLKNVFFIYHNMINKAIRLNRRDSLNFFLQNLFFPFWSKNSLNFVTTFAAGISSDLPVYKFGFKNNFSIVEYINSLNSK